MTHQYVARRVGLLTAATALGAYGLLSGPAPAGARPPFPLAPACSQYQLVGNFSLHQSNGFTVQFSGGLRSSSAVAMDSSGKTVMTGPMTGGIDGSHIDFTAHWTNGETGRYTGDIGPDGIAHGTTTDETHPGSSATFVSSPALQCATTDAGAAGAGGGGADTPAVVTNAITLHFGQPNVGSITATVTNSSDLTGKCTYDATGLVNSHRDFQVSPHSSKDLTFTGFNTGTNYHAVVSCHDASGKQTQEIGHDEADVTF
jgi:hypothetical protein